MSKPSPARYRTTSWSSYSAALRKRGSLLIWLDKQMTWLVPHDGSPGRPAVFSDAAIQFWLTIKVRFKLPRGQTTGMVASLLKMAGLGWAVPDYTTLCRRQIEAGPWCQWRRVSLLKLAVQIPYRRADGPLNLLVDSTGIKFPGDDEWQSRKHGVQGRRVRRAARTGGAPRLTAQGASGHGHGHFGPPGGVAFTPSSDGDSPVLPELLDHIPEGEEIGTVTADGAHDTRRCHTAIIDRQTAEIQIRIALMNRFPAPGATGIVRVG